MAHIECPQHGKVHCVGKTQPKFCPVCGKKVVCVWLLPKIFIEQETLWNWFLIACGIFALFFFAIPGIRGCNADNEKETATKNSRIEAMRPPWHNLYIQIKTAQLDDQGKVVKSFIEKNKNELDKLPDMTPSEAELIFSCLFSGHHQEIADALAPFMAGRTGTTLPAEKK